MMANSLHKIAEQYTLFEIGNKQLSVPYAITFNEAPISAHEGRTSRRSNYAGKGTPAQIRKVLVSRARQKQFDLKTSSADQVRDFMIENGIGIDCSGFVYNVLKQYQGIRHRKLASQMHRFPGLKGQLESILLRPARVRRIGAKTLTSDLNTIKIDKVAAMQPGDMLRLTAKDQSGDHVALVVGITPSYITYAHSSIYTRDNGTHFAKIKILDSSQGLDKQDWLEETSDGHNYGKVAFRLSRGDSVRRLKSLKLQE